MRSAIAFAAWRGQGGHAAAWIITLLPSPPGWRVPAPAVPVL